MTVNTLAVCNECVVAISDDLKQRKSEVVIRAKTEELFFRFLHEQLREGAVITRQHYNNKSEFPYEADGYKWVTT